MVEVPSGSQELTTEPRAQASRTIAVCQHTTCRGQPALQVSLPQGDSILVSLQGAQVLSWVSEGRERLFLSPLARFDGHSAIRGGVPLCFPQFNQRGPLVKHGFARNLGWQVQGEPVLTQAGATLSLCLTDSAPTFETWPFHFVAVVQLALSPGVLNISLSVTQTGAPEEVTSELTFTGALHTYLAVDDVERATLSGLGGQSEWNAVTDEHGRAADKLVFDGEFDRVYAAAGGKLCLTDGDHRLLISQGDSFADTVVWNPGAALCAQLSDMSKDAHRHMLCVEAAAVHTAVTVPSGATWQGWQRLEVA